MTEAGKTILVRIQGHVQGVGFRAFVQREAERLDVKGWVRNRANGDVEAFFAGRRAAVDELVAACRRGPGPARVTDVIVRDENPDGSVDVSTGFRMLPTL
jgi:acylphosphatase